MCTENFKISISILGNILYINKFMKNFFKRVLTLYIIITYNTRVVQNSIKENDIMNNSKVNMFMQVLNGSDDLTKAVVNEVLEGMNIEEDFDHVVNVINDTVKHGCASGVCSPFIYTKDNLNFVQKNLEDVLDFLDEMEYQKRDVDNAYDVNEMTWFVVECCLATFLNEYNDMVIYNCDEE